MCPQHWVRDRSSVSAVLVGAGLLLFFLYRRVRKVPGGKPWAVPPGAVAVGTVKKLLIYPIKSMVAMPELAQVRAVKTGFITDDDDEIRDRSWMVVSDTGVFVSQRAEPKLAHLRVTAPPGEETLHIEAPDGTSLDLRKSLPSPKAPLVDVSVWGSHLAAVDCGQDAADWISAYLGRKGFHVAHLPRDLPARTVVENYHPADKLFEKDDKTIFADAAPIHLLSEASTRDVDEHVDDISVDFRTFRPNILVSGVAPWDEDTWDDIYIGQVKMRNIRLCDRCTLTIVNPDKGEKNANEEPLRTLRKYRPAYVKAPFVGIYLNVNREGSMKVGDTIYVTRKPQ